MKRIIWFVLLSVIGSMADDSVVHFDLVNDYLIVTHCSVGNLLSLKAVVDTGSTDIVIDSSVVRRLSLPTTTDSAVFVTRGTSVLSAVAPSLDFGPIHSGPIHVISSDLSGIGAQLGIRVDVIIGMNLLRQSDFAIDYKARVLRFGPVPPMQHQARFENVEGLAIVPVTGLGFPTNLLVDTGFPRLLVFNDHLSGPDMAHSATVALATGAGQQDLQEIVPPLIEIGDCKFTRPNLLIAPNSGDLQGAFDGLLGPRFLRAHRIGFDFGRRTLSWE